jgi:hypothetical protein
MNQREADLIEQMTLKDGDICCSECGLIFRA